MLLSDSLTASNTAKSLQLVRTLHRPIDSWLFTAEPEADIVHLLLHTNDGAGTQKIFDAQRVRHLARQRVSLPRESDRTQPHV